jgi:uncharacterized repeat protein (TIGR03803 family)
MTVPPKNLVTEIFLRAASAALAFVLGLFPVVGTSSAQAQAYKESVVYTFTGGADGGNPNGGVVMDAYGNFYSTAWLAGSSNAGTVFKVSSTGKETTLYSFTGGADGARPEAGLVFDAKGNLYGTTYQGGRLSQCGGYGCGVVFKLSAAGKLTVLHSFTGGADGGTPEYGTLILDAKGNLYGTAYQGGKLSQCGGLGCGVVYKLNAAGKLTVLHTFTGPDGANPLEGLTLDAYGNLYGTTWNGGSSNAGVVFKINSEGQETVLYNFSGQVDGLNPVSTLILDAKGNLYGTTYYEGYSNAGVVFRVSSTGKETVLHAFSGFQDGAFPQGGLILDRKGNLYGTTQYGGTPLSGNVFKLSSTGKENMLYAFTDAPDGAVPYAGLIFDGKGNLYGTTFSGGSANKACLGGGGCGTLFKLTR